MSEAKPNRSEFEHVKQFLLTMDGLIPAIKMKLAVVSAQNSLHAGRYHAADIEEISGMLVLAWGKAFHMVEKFPSLSDTELMFSAVESHFSLILRGYGLDPGLTSDVMKVFEGKLRRLSPSGSGRWEMGTKTNSLRHHVIPNCRHTESEELAADNFMTLSAHNPSDIGAELSKISAECVQSLMAEVSRNPQMAYVGDAGKRTLAFLALRSMQLGIPVMHPIMSMMSKLDSDIAAETMFHLPIDFEIEKLSPDARRQFSAILSRASLSPGAEIMFTVQFPGLTEDVMRKIVDSARAGEVFYI